MEVLAGKISGRRGAAALVALLIVVYAIGLASFYYPATYCYDANGYWAQGSLLAREGRTWFESECGAQHIGMHWLVGDNGRFVSRYSPGLAVPIAALYALFGYRAGPALNPILAIGTLIGFALLAWRMLRPWMAVAAVVWLMLNNVFMIHTLKCDSHMAVTCLLVWGSLFLLRWYDQPRLLSATLAGVCLGAIPAIRYPEAILAVGPMVVLLVRIRQTPRLWFHLLAAGLGVAIPIVPLLIRNHLLFGAFWKTGYALSNEQAAFGFSFFVKNFPCYLRDFWHVGLAPTVAIGIVGLAWLAARRDSRVAGIALLAMVLAPSLVYFSYYWMLPGGEFATLRFLLPELALLTLGAAWCLDRWTRPRPARLQIGLTIGVVLLLHGLWSAPIGWRVVRVEAARRHILATVAEVLDQHVPPGSVIIAHNRIQDYLDYVRKWKLVDSTLIDGRAMMEMIAVLQTENRQIHGLQKDRWRQFAWQYGAPGSPELQARFARDIRTWASPAKVYYIGAKEDITSIAGTCFWPDFFVPILEADVPPPPGHTGPLKKLLLAEWTWYPGAVAPGRDPQDADPASPTPVPTREDSAAASAAKE